MFGVVLLIKNHTLTVRLSDIEYKGIESASKELGVSKAEVVRRFYWTIRVLFSDDLTLKEALIDGDVDYNQPLSNTLRNIPELLIDMIERGKRIK